MKNNSVKKDIIDGLKEKLERAEMTVVLNSMVTSSGERYKAFATETKDTRKRTKERIKKIDERAEAFEIESELNEKYIKLLKEAIKEIKAL